MNRLETFSTLLRRRSKSLRYGDSVAMYYDGEEIARYNYDESCNERDAKSLDEWLRGCWAFLIQMNGRDESKVGLKVIPKENQG